MELKTSLYRNFSDEAKECDLLKIIDDIKNGLFQNEILELREAKTNLKKFGELKKQLPHFTPSGTFEKHRKVENLSSYNSVIVIDIDHIGEKAEEIRNQAAKINSTLASFLSPSGNGVKILVLTDAKSEDHELAFNQVTECYEKELNFQADRSGKDISRACFVSYDPELFLNKNVTTFSVYRMTPLVNFSSSNSTYDSEIIFKAVLDFTKNIDSYYTGNRNSFIYKLANNLNRAGFDVDDAVKKISANFADPDMSVEIPKAVKSAYNNTSEHGIFSPEYYSSASFAKTAMGASGAYEYNTPVITEDIYSRLPRFLKESAFAFEGIRERDIFFTSALTIMSGMFKNVYGIYDGRKYYPNLYNFTIAGPGSCKGVAIFARQLGDVIHENLEANSDKDVFSNITDGNKLKWFFIPGDSSSAAIKRMLSSNYECGTICETEADTLSGALAQDWGSFDDLLRKGFQHEPITNSRVDKDKDEVILREIKHPKLSVCLTGTPSQVSTLLKSTENGLFSRFIFYTFRNEDVPEFKDVFSKDHEVPHDEYFSQKAVDVYEMYCRINELGTCCFSLNNDQKKRFKEQFNSNLKRLHEKYGEETHAIVFRLGLITFRIAMLLSILRMLEGTELSNSIECREVDFQNSLDLSDIYLEHSLSVFQKLPGFKQVNQNSMLLLNYLPKEFSYSIAEKIGQVYCDFSSRSIYSYLKDLVKHKYLTQPKQNGLYYKS